MLQDEAFSKSTSTVDRVLSVSKYFHGSVSLSDRIDSS